MNGAPTFAMAPGIGWNIAFGMAPGIGWNIAFGMAHGIRRVECLLIGRALLQLFSSSLCYSEGHCFSSANTCPNCERL